MADLKIRVYKNSSQEPETTVTIPIKILKIASSLIPKRAADALQDKGINISEIIKISKKPGLQGTLIEIEEHKKKERVLIAIE